MSDLCEMAANHKSFGNAAKTQPEAKACALTKKFNCVCPECDSNNIVASNAFDKKADHEINKLAPTL